MYHYLHSLLKPLSYKQPFRNIQLCDCRSIDWRLFSCRESKQPRTVNLRNIHYLTLLQSSFNIQQKSFWKLKHLLELNFTPNIPHAQSWTRNIEVLYWHLIFLKYMSAGQVGKTCPLLVRTWHGCARFTLKNTTYSSLYLKECCVLNIDNKRSKIQLSSEIVASQLIHSSTFDFLLEVLGFGFSDSAGSGEPGGSEGGLGAFITSGSESREGPLDTPETQVQGCWWCLSGIHQD